MKTRADAVAMWNKFDAKDIALKKQKSHDLLNVAAACMHVGRCGYFLSYVIIFWM